MSRTGLPEKWIDDLSAEGLVTEAAQRVLEKRVGAVASMIKSVVKSRGEENDSVHQLRVSTRRAQAALQVFKPWVRRRRRSEAKDAMKRLRSAAGAVRMCDVHRSLLVESLKSASVEERAAIEAALVLLSGDADTARHELFETAQQRAARRLPSSSGRWLQRARKVARECSVSENGQGDDHDDLKKASCTTDLRSAGDRALADLCRDFLAASRQDLSRRDNLHRMRLQGKAMRYAIEIFGATASQPEALTQVHESLIHLQDRLGAINDCEEVGQRLARYATNLEAEVRGNRKPAETKEETPEASSLAPVMRRTSDHFESRCNVGVVDFLEWWHGEEAMHFREHLESLAAVTDSASESAEAEPPATQVEQISEPSRVVQEAGERPDAEVVVLSQRNGSSAEPVLAGRTGDER